MTWSYWGAADSRPCWGTFGWCLQWRGQDRDRQAPTADHSSPVGSSLPHSDLGWSQGQKPNMRLHTDLRQLWNTAISVWSLINYRVCLTVCGMNILLQLAVQFELRDNPGAELGVLRRSCSSFYSTLQSTILQNGTLVPMVTGSQITFWEP